MQPEVTSRPNGLRFIRLDKIHTDSHVANIGYLERRMQGIHLFKIPF